MSYDDYAKYIVQKYRLAIALAVIKTIPENTTLEEHITQLRNKFSSEDMELDDFNISINSDDFQFDETNDFGADINIIHDDCDINDKVFSQLDVINNEHHENHTKVSKSQELSVNLSQNKAEKEMNKPQNEVINNENETNNEEMIDMQNLNDSVTILRNYGTEKEDISKFVSETIQKNSFDEVMDILKEIDNGITKTENATLNKNPSNRIQEIDTLTQLPESMDETQCYIDNDETHCSSIKLPTTIDKEIVNQKPYCLIVANNIAELTSDQKVKENIASADKIDNNKNEMLLTTKDVNNRKANKTTASINEYCPDNVNRSNNTESNIKSDIRSYRHTKEFKNVYKNIAGMFGTTNTNEEIKLQVHPKNLDKNLAQISQIAVDFKDNPKVSQNMIQFNTTQDFTCKTHYSQSQINDIITIEDKYIHGVKRNNNQIKDDTKEIIYVKKKKEGNIILIDEVVSGNIQQIGNTGTDTTTNMKNNSAENKFLSLPITVPENRTICTDEVNIKANTEGVYSQDSIFSQELPIVSIPSNYTHTFGQYYEQREILDNIQHKNSANVNDNNIKVGIQDFNQCTLKANNSKSISNNSNQYKNDNNLKATSKIQYVEKEFFSEESQLTNFSTFANDTCQNYMSEDTLRYSQYIGDIENKYKNTEDGRYKVEFPNKNSVYFEKCQNNFKNADQSKATNDDKTENTETNNNMSNIKKYDTENIVQPKDQKVCTNIDKNMNSTENLQHKTSEMEEDLKNPLKTKSCTNIDDNLEDIEETTESEVEIIPFKIIEELNKVKLYLSKRYDKNLSIKGCSGDTGYRSDSNSRNSLKLSLTSSSWLDQTAQCLFNFIKECPLISATGDITNEISIILGQLIDKLYEEENCPKFLEDMMESIQTTLGRIHEGDPEETMLTIKDEYIHRIILFNKSLHLKKYTIEKITQKLENLHRELTSNNSEYEMKNIIQIENISYIFHLLEILLKKYKRSQNLSQKTQNLSQETQFLSQNTQNSQEEEKLIRRSGITDIWRKKWNPNLKTVKNDGSQEKKCVLNSCSAVLNKLIVDCMEGYSLISYYALKCFNVMQN